MNIVCSKESLTKILSIAEGIISAKDSISILSNVLLIAKDSKLEIYASDQILNFYGDIGIDVIENGSIAVNSSKFFNLCKKLEGEEIEITSNIDDFQMVINPKNNKKSVYTLKGIDPAKFSKIDKYDDIDFFSIKQTVFHDMINKTKFAISLNEGRRFASGILFENNSENLIFVSTDGKRLAKIENEVKIDYDISNIIVPLKILNEVSKLLIGEGELHIAIVDTKIVIKIDNYTFISNLLDGSFPSYEKVIPTDQDKKLIIEKDKLKSTIERISQISDKKSNRLIISIDNNEMTLFAENVTLGKGTEIIDIDFPYDGESIKIALNTLYILDVLNAIKSKNIIFEFKNSQSTITVKEENNDNYIYIMMPMSL